jgi:hypothetical protein
MPHLKISIHITQEKRGFNMNNNKPTNGIFKVSTAVLVKVAGSLETSVNVHQIIRCYIPED